MQGDDADSASRFSEASGGEGSLASARARTGRIRDGIDLRIRATRLGSSLQWEEAPGTAWVDTLRLFDTHGRDVTHPALWDHELDQDPGLRPDPYPVFAMDPLPGDDAEGLNWEVDRVVADGEGEDRLSDDSRWGTWIATLAMSRMLPSLDRLCGAYNLDLASTLSVSGGPQFVPAAQPDAQMFLGALHVQGEDGSTHRVLIRDALLHEGRIQPPTAVGGEEDSLSSGSQGWHPLGADGEVESGEEDDGPTSDGEASRGGARRGVPPGARGGVNDADDHPAEAVVLDAHDDRLTVVERDGRPTVDDCTNTISYDLRGVPARIHGGDFFPLRNPRPLAAYA